MMKEMEQLQSCFDVLTLESAERFFEKNAEKSSFDGYVICNGVPVEMWNSFLDQREENLPIPLRFIEYDDGKIIIIELPSGDHEDFIRKFETEFVVRSHWSTWVYSCIQKRIRGNERSRCDVWSSS
jgi:hypothetical protein